MAAMQASDRVETSPAKPDRMGRITVLDGVRGLAILLVVIYHYAQVPVSRQSLFYYPLALTSVMWSGVDLFFVLSGLLIGGTLIDHRTSPNYYSTFYLRRIFRIFPIYYLMIALLVVGQALFPRSPLFAGHMPVWLFPLFAQNLVEDFTRAPLWITVSWSLAVEEQFYLLFPFVVRALSPRALLRFAIAAVIGAPILRAVLVANGFGFGFVYALSPCRADALGFGVLAAIIIRSEPARRWVVQHARLYQVCLPVLCCVAFTVVKWPRFSYQTAGYSILALTYFLLTVLLLVNPLPWQTAVFSQRWLCWLGTVSYCVYLIHQPVRYGVLTLLSHPRSGVTTAIAIVTALLFTLAIAQVSWIFFEKRLIRYAHLRSQY